jgi:hypothetical protein
MPASWGQVALEKRSGRQPVRGLCRPRGVQVVPALAVAGR